MTESGDGRASGRGALLPFLLIMTLYLGMEMVAAHRVGYRLEATYSLDQFAAEAEAVARCATPDPDRLSRFERNFDVVVRRARREAAEGPEAGDDASIAAALDARAATRAGEVAAIIDEAGCDDPRIRTLLQRFAIHARLNAGGPAPKTPS